MTTKITKESLKEMIRNILEEKMKSAERIEEEEEEIEEQSKTDRPDRVAGRDSGGRRLDEGEVCPVCEKEECECEPVEESVESADEPANTDLNGTPEREKNLYESRFAKRNTKLFEDLVKKWTK